VRTPRLSRRQLIRTGLASSITAALAGWVGPGAATVRLSPGDRATPRRTPSASHTVGPPVPLHAVVLDERFAEAARFGGIARGQGLPTRAMRGDVTDFWYSELHPLWKQRAVPVAGLTAYAALFCLEQLAWDHRMRVVYRGAHALRADGSVEHVLAGPQEIVDALSPGAACDWPAKLASAIARVESRGGWTGLAPAETSLGPLPASTLYSWVIALPSRA
jgi:hypothetical protein